MNCPAPVSALHHFYTIELLCLILDIQSIETTQTNTGPATLGFNRYAFFHQTIEKVSNLVYTELGAENIVPVCQWEGV